MTTSTASARPGLAARLIAALRPASAPALQPVPVRRLLALGLLPLALVPDAFAQRGGTTGRPSDPGRGGPRRDTVVARAPERPRGTWGDTRTPTPDVGRGERRPQEPGRSGEVRPHDPYGDAQRRIDQQRREQERRAEEQRRQGEARQREAEQRIEAQRRQAEERQREAERRIEQQRQEQEARMREAQRRAGGQGGYPGYGDRYGAGDQYGYGDRYDRYWGSSWSPVLRFRQRVRIQSDRAYSYGREHVLEIRTHYRQRASGGSYGGERLELRIERLDVYQNGRYLGYVDNYDLPSDFDHVRATRDRRTGELRLEDDLLLVGEASAGFELIRYDGNDFYGSWRRQYDALALDLRRSSARRIGWSRLFDPYDYRGYAPVSIVPDFQDDFYGYGGYYGQPGYGGYGQPGYGQPGYDRSRDGYEGPVQGRSPRGATRGSGEVAPQARPDARSPQGSPGTRPAPTRSPRNRTLTLPGGQQVQVERETEVAPAEGGN